MKTEEEKKKMEQSEAGLTFTFISEDGGAK